MKLFRHTSQQSRALFCHTMKLFCHTMKLFYHTMKLFSHTMKLPFCVKKLYSILEVSDVFGVKSFVGVQITSLGTRGSFKALASLRSAWASNWSHLCPETVISISRNGLLKSCARFVIERSEIRKTQHDFKSVHFQCRIYIRVTLDMRNHKPTTTYQKLSIF